ncbi:hypothetical protein Tco_0485281 [Tanacetum coccineum]
MSASFQANISKFSFRRLQTSILPFSDRLPPIMMVWSGYFGWIATLILSATAGFLGGLGSCASVTILHSAGIMVVLRIVAIPPSIGNFSIPHIMKECLGIHCENQITDFDLAKDIRIENIVVNLDSSSDNNNSDSYSTSQISTSEEIDYDSPEPPKSLLKWYHYLSDEYKDNGRFWGSKSGCNESDVKPSWKDIEKAKACMLAKAQASEASSKAKVEACGSKAKLQASTKTLIVKSPVPITNCVLGLANAKTRDAIKGKTFGVKIQ